MSKYATLTAGLLARKGEAEPTSTPFVEQLLTRVAAPAPDISALTPMPHHVHVHAEPGVMPKQQGFGPRDTSALLTSVFGTVAKRNAQAVVRQKESLAKPPVAPALAVVAAHDDEEVIENHCGGCVGPAGDDAGKTYHVNLRLRRLRFVKLKLSAALLRRPVQDIVSEALDQWFEKLPRDVLGDCACLTARGE
jgi:hypothetical protein